MSKYNDDKYIAMSNFTARLNAAIMEDIAPHNASFNDYNELSKIYSHLERKKDFLVILEAKKNVPDEVIGIARAEAEKWAMHYDVNVEYR